MVGLNHRVRSCSATKLCYIGLQGHGTERNRKVDGPRYRRARDCAMLTTRTSKLGTRSVQRTEQHRVAVLGEMEVKKVGREEIPTIRILIRLDLEWARGCQRF